VYRIRRGGGQRKRVRGYASREAFGGLRRQNGTPARASVPPTRNYGQRVAVMGLGSLERAKRSAGRLKDLADPAEIEEIKKRRLS